MPRSLIAFALHYHWQRMRLFHFAGSVLTDYRIIKNHAARLMRSKVKC